MKKSPAVLTLSFVGLLHPGCGGADGFLGEDAVLHGEIEGWTRGPGYSLSAAVLRLPTATQPLTSAPIRASGSFDIELPSSGDIADAMTTGGVVGGGDGCSSVPTIAPADAKSAQLLLSVTKPGSTPAPLLLFSRKLGGLPHSGDTTASILYTDRDSRIDGKLRCGTEGSSASVDYHVTLRKGWNTILSRYQEVVISQTGTRIVAESFNGPLPPELTWQTGDPRSF